MQCCSEKQERMGTIAEEAANYLGRDIVKALEPNRRKLREDAPGLSVLQNENDTHVRRAFSLEFIIESYWGKDIV